MKKLLFLGIAATAMLASCTNDEVVEMNPQQGIGFNTFVEKSTRGVTNLEKSNLGEIFVYGWRGETQLFGATENNINKGQTVNSSDGSYQPIKYWEPNFTYNFEAIKPQNGESGLTFTPAVVGGTINFNNETAGAVIDLLYAKASATTTSTTITSMPKVNFTFDHMLSRVKFTISNGFAATSVANITVSDIVITNTAKEGSIAYNATDWSTNDTNNDLPVTFATTKNNIVKPSETISTEEMVLIPANREYIVQFSVTLDQAGVKSTQSYEAKVQIDLTKQNSYNLTATIDPDTFIPGDSKMLPIEFNVENVNSWTENTVATGTLNAGTASGN